MPRPFYSIIYEVIDLIKKNYTQFKRQKTISAFVIVLALIFIAVLFAFFSFVQTISPFVYPLF